MLFIPPEGLPALHKLTLFWRNIGWVGVDLFFVLSGFLVSGLLFKEYLLQGSISPGRFLLRRALKLYPAFYFFLIVGTGIFYPLANMAIPMKGLVGEVFFLQNYVGSLWLHTWTLAVEEQFYLALIAIVMLFSTRTRDGNAFRYVPYVFAAVAISVLAGRLIIGYGFSKPWPFLLSPTHCRIDSLFFGVFLSYLYHFHAERFVSWAQTRRPFIFVTSALALSPIFFLSLNDTALPTFGFSLLYVGFGGVLILAVTAGPAATEFFRRRRITLMLGRHSYSIYLWHVAAFNVAMLSGRALHGGTPRLETLWALYLLFALGGGTAMSLLVEQPVLRLRNRLFPSRCGNLESAINR